jgi:hypothetical protein
VSSLEGQSMARQSGGVVPFGASTVSSGRFKSMERHR